VRTALSRSPVFAFTVADASITDTRKHQKDSEQPERTRTPKIGTENSKEPIPPLAPTNALFTKVTPGQYTAKVINTTESGAHKFEETKGKGRARKESRSEARDAVAERRRGGALAGVLSRLFRCTQDIG
jgi:hypothetical protein